MWLDIRKEPILALETYRQDKRHIQTFYGLSQDDPKLAGILADHFPDGIDLIVYDASHQYQQSRKTFHLCFPHLKPGGALRARRLVLVAQSPTPRAIAPVA